VIESSHRSTSGFWEARSRRLFTKSSNCPLHGLRPRSVWRTSLRSGFGPNRSSGSVADVVGSLHNHRSKVFGG